MNMHSKFRFILLLILALVQVQLIAADAETKNAEVEEELPLIDPFSGGGTSSKALPGQMNSGSDLINDLKLVGTILGKNKKIAVFSARDGSSLKYKENQYITDTVMLLEIMHNLVIVQDANNKRYEMYMNNIIKPSEG
jgi:hypothetical protein